MNAHTVQIHTHPAPFRPRIIDAEVVAAWALAVALFAALLAF